MVPLKKTNIWDIPSFLIDFTCLLTTTRSPVSNYLMKLPLLRISLCLRLLSDTRTLNNSRCINISGKPPQSDPRLVILLKYPPLTLMVIGKLEMGNLCRYPLLIEQCQFRLLSLNSKRTVQITRLATIGESCPCLLSLSSAPCSSTYVNLNL